MGSGRKPGRGPVKPRTSGGLDQGLVMSMRQPAAETVSTLLCHSHVPMALDCLGSLVRLCEDKISLRIFDDGSLTKKDCDLLQERFEDAQIIPCELANERIRDEYVKYTNILDLRENYPHIRKAFEIASKRYTCPFLVSK